MNDPTPNPDSLARLARRAAGDRFFLSHALTAYQDRQGLDDAGLAALVGCPVAVLPSVRLCRTPRVDDPAAFEDDVKVISDRFRLDAVALARIVRECGR
ncbi:MAG TPA: hypothetical protein VFW33_08625 [Gemmataceae bacterium]|nr:hypothetical protein [Gemmataceae bacterium]